VAVSAALAFFLLPPSQPLCVSILCVQLLPPLRLLLLLPLSPLWAAAAAT